MGKKNNQKFVQIPFHKLIAAIENKCVKEGIRFLKQEESYTSKLVFLYILSRVTVLYTI